MQIKKNQENYFESRFDERAYRNPRRTCLPWLVRHISGTNIQWHGASTSKLQGKLDGEWVRKIVINRGWSRSRQCHGGRRGEPKKKNPPIEFWKPGEIRIIIARWWDFNGRETWWKEEKQRELDANFSPEKYNVKHKRGCNYTRFRKSRTIMQLGKMRTC